MDLKQYGVIKTMVNSDSYEDGNTTISNNSETDLMEVWRLIILRKWTILKISGVFTVAAMVYVLLATPYFQSTISLYPAGELAQSSPFGGNISGLAESFGVGGLSPTPIYNIPDIVNSRRLKKNIVLRNWKNSSFSNSSNLIKYWEIDKPKIFSIKKIISKFLPASKYPTDPFAKHTELAIQKLNDLISVEEETSGLITVSVLMEEPQLAADIANYIADFVKNFISVEQHREAVRNKKFIEEQQMLAKKELEISEEVLTEFRKKHPLALDTPDLQLDRGRLMRNVEENQAVYITLRQQYEIAKIEEAQENLLVNILDDAEPAVNKSKPKRKLIVLFVFFSTMFLTGLFQVIRLNYRTL